MLMAIQRRVLLYGLRGFILVEADRRKDEVVLWVEHVRGEKLMCMRTLTHCSLMSNHQFSRKLQTSRSVRLYHYKLITYYGQGVLLHPRTKEAVTGESEGEIYAFEYMTSEELATTAAAFRVDGAYGRYDVDWLRQALEASALRTAGAFDEHDAEQFEKDWAEEDEGVSDEEVEKDKEESESMGEVVEKTNSPMDKDPEPMEEYEKQP
jgi:hypothetical protein